MGRNFSVLHLLPHTGGGMGTVLLALLEAELRGGAAPTSSVVSLERLNEGARHRLDSLGIPWVDGIAMGGDRKKLMALIEKADIVLVHWWNHPLLMQLLFEGLPPSRLVLWSHVNGFAAPQSFFPELFNLPDRFIFATKASLQSPVVLELPEKVMCKLRVIRSCAGIPSEAAMPYKKEGPFLFGYVGTVEPAKMHAAFLELCACARIPAKCVVVGGPAHDELRTRAKHLGVSDKFEILGPLEDPRPIFKRLHAFAYPLSPGHYGTGEQVLIEAMAYGAVPVVFANPPEKAIIRHGETGLIANTPEEFSDALRFLAENEPERRKMAAAGRQFVIDECDIRTSVKDFGEIYQEMLSFSKRPHRLSLPSFDGIADGSPFHLFLASCGSDAMRNYFQRAEVRSGKESLPVEFVSGTRGTPQHYLRLLGEDPNLESICKPLCSME